MMGFACSLVVACGLVWGGEDPGVRLGTPEPAESLASACPSACPCECPAPRSSLFDLSSLAALFPPSDSCFPRFISPISNPVLSKDPRALSQIYPVFLGDWIPSSHPVDGGSFQVYGMGLTVALDDSWEVGIVKGGVADKHFANGDNGAGFSTSRCT